MLKIIIIFCALFLGSCVKAQIQSGQDSSGKDKTFKQQLILTDQSLNRIAIADVSTGKIIWDWRASESNVRPQDVKWFNAPSDAKAVYDNKYILLNASLGGVALVRIADKKTMFYAYAGGNTHSAELLPDGNIVTASSTGSYLMIFHADSSHFPDNVYCKKIYLPFAHNVVWDKKRELLWSAGKNKLYSFRYNFNCEHPDLIMADSTVLPDTDAHDLFPIYGKDSLWLTTVHGVFKIDPSTKKITVVKGNYTENIKNVSSGPKGFPVIGMLPKVKWWTDEVLDNKGNSIFKEEGLKLYKVRWLLPNLFSYPQHDEINFCK
jgi:hypothetical protein